MTPKDTIVVTGSRGYTDFSRVMSELCWLHEYASRVVHGDCRTGADKLATKAALSLGMELKTYPVDYKLDGPWPYAGPRRNERMLMAERARICVVLAFTSRHTGELTSGTKDCVEKAERLGLRVERVKP